MMARDGKTRSYASVLLKHEAFGMINSATDIDDLADDNFAEEIESTPLADFNKKYVFNVQSFQKSPRKADVEMEELDTPIKDLRVNLNISEEPDLPDSFLRYNSPDQSPASSPKGTKQKISLPSNFNIFAKKCDQ